MLDPTSGTHSIHYREPGHEAGRGVAYSRILMQAEIGDLLGFVGKLALGCVLAGQIVVI
jgi:hypothetical protein